MLVTNERSNKIKVTATIESKKWNKKLLSRMKSAYGPIKHINTSLSFGSQRKGLKNTEETSFPID